VEKVAATTFAIIVSLNYRQEQIALLYRYGQTAKVNLIGRGILLRLSHEQNM